MSTPDLSAMDPQARRFLAMVALGAAAAEGVSAEDRRRSFEKLMRFSKPPPAELAITDARIPSAAGGVPVRVYAPHDAPAVVPGLVYFHGGGLVAGSIETHDALCRSLAHEAGCRVISIGYRLAPEHPFPAAIVDALVAVRWITRHPKDCGLAPEAIAVGGDSGGGTLAAIVCQVLRRGAIKAQVLLCPVLDFGGAHASRTIHEAGFLLDRSTMNGDLTHYEPTRHLDNPRISPLREPSLVGLPHTIIHSAGFDPLRDENAAYARRLREAGVTVDHTCHGNLIHHFYALTGPIPAARLALSAIAADIRRALF